MIAVAPIVPTAYLRKLPKELSTVHLALAHQVLSDESYRDFYKKQHDAYVILDNSAFELGEAMGNAAMLQAMAYIKPDEIVLPDILFDAEGTLQRVTDFLAEYSPLLPMDTHFMAVPHGNSIEEYLECYKKLAAMPQVYALGIGTLYNRVFEGGRKAIFEALQEQGTLSSKPHHLLGLGDGGNIELEGLKKFAEIRSCDSSAAYIQAKQGITLVAGKTYKKIDQKINFSDLYDEAVAVRMQHNLQLLQEAGQ